MALSPEKPPVDLLQNEYPLSKIKIEGKLIQN
jgi:hypothetical protein